MDESYTEKLVPKKIVIGNGHGYNGYSCPNCGCDNTNYGIMYDGFIPFNYCSQCGQALDWSDYGEEDDSAS